MLKWIIAGSLLAALLGWIGYSVWYFNQQIARETQALLSTVSDQQPIISEAMTRDLPAPVKRWLDNSGIMGKPAVKAVHLKQKGTLRLQPEQKEWIPSEAEQSFTTEQPGFIWRVKTSMAGVPVIGRDLFMHGQGAMEIRLAGSFPVIKIANHEKINESTLQRYLGEIIWFPSAALSEFIDWEPVDESRAKATMSYGGTSGSAIFHFNEQGEVNRFVAYRYRDINDESPTEWVATVKETRRINGIAIPTSLEAAWILESGVFTWYTFEIDDVTYTPSPQDFL